LRLIHRPGSGHFPSIRYHPMHPSSIFVVWSLPFPTDTSLAPSHGAVKSQLVLPCWTAFLSLAPHPCVARSKEDRRDKRDIGDRARLNRARNQCVCAGASTCAIGASCDGRHGMGHSVTNGYVRGRVRARIASAWAHMRVCECASGCVRVRTGACARVCVSRGIPGDVRCILAHGAGVGSARIGATGCPQASAIPPRLL
jgi:hypothetical protein